MTSYEMMDAHFLTILIVTAAMLITPMYLVCTYYFSGASVRKGVALGSVSLLLGALMTWVCLARVPDALGPLGSLIIPICWITPSLVLWIYRDWFLAEPLSQHWLVGLQVWRVIGGVFLIEYSRQNIPGIFAFPAGIGDLVVGVLAATVLVVYGRREHLPRFAIVLVLVLGVADFISAFFFGYFSSNGPLQIFYPEISNNVVWYPTGLIPLFLVPYAIFFHTLSYLSLRQSATSATTVDQANQMGMNPSV